MAWEAKGTVAGKTILSGKKERTLSPGGRPALHESAEGPAAGRGGQSGRGPVLGGRAWRVSSESSLFLGR